MLKARIETKMPEQPQEPLPAIWHAARFGARRGIVRALAALRELWHLVRPPLSFALQVVFALILLFEEWGWRPLVAALAWLSRFGPWARLELFIASLPPYAALALLALPTSLLFPLKLLSVYLLASGQVFAAGALFFGVKVASTALIARLFLLTKPALMRIGWFAAAYDWLMPWKDALFAEIRASWAWRYGRLIKTRARHETVQAWTRARPSLLATWHALRNRTRETWARFKPAIEHQAGRLRLALLRVLGRA
jgi:hypothetical protein